MPSPLTHTKLSDLIIKTAKAIDSYNANDLTLSDTDTDQDTLGERIKICLNLSLGVIYSLIKDSKYLEALPKESVMSEANKDFIQLDIVPELDDVEAIMDTTNEQRLVRYSWSWYRTHYPNPANQTGTPEAYIIRSDRLYLAPRPVSALPYTIDFKKLTKDLKLANDIPLLPSNYDGWVIAETKVKFYEMEDPTSVPPLIISERNDIRQASIDAIMTSYDYARVSQSHFERNETPHSYGYQRPVGS